MSNEKGNFSDLKFSIYVWISGSVCFVISALYLCLTSFLIKFRYIYSTSLLNYWPGRGWQLNEALSLFLYVFIFLLITFMFFLVFYNIKWQWYTYNVQQYVWDSRWCYWSWRIFTKLDVATEQEEYRAAQVLEEEFLKKMYVYIYILVCGISFISCNIYIYI